VSNHDKKLNKPVAYYDFATDAQIRSRIRKSTLVLQAINIEEFSKISICASVVNLQIAVYKLYNYFWRIHYGLNNN
jgi:hypothetical protein